MNDPEIREVLMSQLVNEYAGTGALVIPELAVHNDAARVDVAVIGSNEFVGYEIKSEVDTLARLPGQVRAYGRVFDRMYLVTTANHLEEAAAVIPKWWGVIIAEAGPDGITLRRLLTADRNQSEDMAAQAELLWRPECMEALEANGGIRGLKKKPRLDLWPVVGERYGTDQLRALVHRAMVSRRKWTAERSLTAHTAER